MPLSRVGEIGINKNGTAVKIIEDNGKEIVVEFQDEHHYQMKTIYANFKSGHLKNPFDKTICGVGYIGIGKYTTGTSKEQPREYHAWRNMIKRCYDKSLKEKFSSYYEDCIVCNEWHNYQNFAEWFNDNFYQVGTERMHIDKDILIAGNKVYGPETCIIVPQGLNMLFMNRPNNRGLPNGISKQYNGMYLAIYNHKELGKYNTIKEAYDVYVKEKKSHIKQVADTYKGDIPIKVYKAIINHKFDMMFDKNYIHKDLM